MIRSAFSVVAGFFGFSFATLALWTVFGYGPQDTPSQGFLLGSLFCEVFFCLGAGYLTAWIAGKNELGHSFALATAMVLQATVSLIVAPDLYPIWVPLSTMLVLAPCCYLGGKLRLWTIQRHGTPATV